MTQSPASDELYLHRALLLAREGIGLTSPNPCVGAVIVDDQGDVVGTGSHTYAGVKHAEVLALEHAGEKARGATLYINLEPCSHQGRTGPCVDAVIASGIRRVVASMPDPNPEVAGRGFEKLRAAGIELEVGLLGDEARYLNESFARYIRTKLPLVTLKAAMTLDGKIAPPPPELERSKVSAEVGGYITSEQARAHVQELRHASDAILVGVGTIVADDPLLTDRTRRARRRPLLRVIVDSLLRLPLESQVISTAKDDVLVLCSLAEETRKKRLVERGIKVEQVSSGAADGRPDMAAVVKHLGAMQITSLLIEGGSLVNWSALASGVADKVFLYYAPKILAGHGSVPFAAGAGFRRMDEAAHIKSVKIHRFGEDIALEGYLRDPYA